MRKKSEKKVIYNQTVRVSAFKRGLMNFKVHFMRYILVSLAISIGILAFMLSLSSGNIMEQSIADFKEKTLLLTMDTSKVKMTEQFLNC